MICSRCNSKNTKTANFCNKCGQNLNGEISNDNMNNFNNILKDIKNIIIKPIDTIKDFIKEENYMTSLLYLGLNIILLAFCILIVIYSFTNLYGNYLNFDNLYTYFNIPYFRLFLVIIMTGVIIYCLFATIIYLISNYVFKSKTSIKKIAAWLGINSLFNTILIIFLVISLLVSLKLGFLVYLIGSILYTYNLYRSLEYCTDIDNNKIGYLLMPSIIIVFIVVSCVLPKIFF